MNTQFGYKAIQIGSVVVYTGKLRLKEDIIIPDGCSKFMTNKGYYIVSFETTDHTVFHSIIQILGNICKQRAQNKLNLKYGYLTQE